MPERETVGRDNDGVGFPVDKASLAKGFGIHNRRIDIGENFKLVGHARVIAVAGNAVADHPFTALLLHKRLDHAVFQRHAANPAIRHNGHDGLLPLLLWCCRHNSRRNASRSNGPRRCKIARLNLKKPPTPLMSRKTRSAEAGGARCPGLTHLLDTSLSLCFPFVSARSPRAEVGSWVTLPGRTVAAVPGAQEPAVPGPAVLGVAAPRPHFSVPESRRLTHHETHSNAHRVAFSSRYGHRHQPNISAALRALNAAHASPVALAHASPRSIVGKLAEYDRAMQLALAMPQNTPAEIAARDQAIANARLMLADQTDRTITPQVISRVDYLLGLPPSNPMLGTSLAPTPVAPAPPRGEVIASPLPPPHAPRAEDPPRANDPPVPSPVQVIAAPAPPDDAPRLAAPPAPPAPPSPPQPAMPPPPPSPPELFN